MCELQQKQHYKSKGQPPYLSKTIRFALFALYFFSGVQNVVTIFSISFVIFLVKLKFGNVDAIEAAKLLREANSISNDVILISDEMYLQKKFNILVEGMLVQTQMATFKNELYL